MNHHSAPPGGWEPPEPPWVQEMRDLVAQANRLADRMHGAAQHFARMQRLSFLWWMLGGLGGYWVGFGSVELLKWWAGLR